MNEINLKGRNWDLNSFSEGKISKCSMNSIHSSVVLPSSQNAINEVNELNVPQIELNFLFLWLLIANLVVEMREIFSVLINAYKIPLADGEINSNSLMSTEGVIFANYRHKFERRKNKIREKVVVIMKRFENIQ